MKYARVYMNNKRKQQQLKPTRNKTNNNNNNNKIRITKSKLLNKSKEKKEREDGEEKTKINIPSYAINYKNIFFRAVKLYSFIHILVAQNRNRNLNIKIQHNKKDEKAVGREAALLYKGVANIVLSSVISPASDQD